MALVHDVGLVIADKYRLLRCIGAGGMGSVWTAKHLLLDTDVAIKFMADTIDQSETARKRFEREARASLVIKSPHVVQVLDYGIQDDSPYIVMELLEGEDLSALLARAGRLSLASTYRILEPVVKALRRAHEVGLVHRDLKPANIFIARSGNEEVVKILDFGIAKDVDPKNQVSMTSSGALIGSPLYMSPEQVREAKYIDHRSDLWSLGIILYEALLGRTPFYKHENVGSLLVAICTETWDLPSSVVPTLDPEVDVFFRRALAREASERFQSATEMLESFAPLCGIRPPVPSLPIGPERKEITRLASDPRGTETTTPERTDPHHDKPEQDQEKASAPKEAAPSSTNDAAVVSRPVSDSLVASRGRPSNKSVAVVSVASVALFGLVAAFVLRGAGMTSTNPLPANTDNALTSPPATHAAGAPSPLATAPAAPLTRTGKLEIEPNDALVLVDGEKVLVVSGVVEITGEIGSTHDVVVRSGENETKSKVVIAAAGLVPDKLTVEAAKDVKPAAKTASQKEKPTSATTATATPTAVEKAPPPPETTAAPDFARRFPSGK